MQMMIQIDRYEFSIEEQVVNLIALRQPMAIDLRETVVALKIASDLERIGDLSKNIAKRIISIQEIISSELIKETGNSRTKNCSDKLT